MAEIVATATRASVLVQLITGAAGFYGLSVPIKPESFVLKQVLGLEMVVQVIELIFYFVFLNIFDLATLTQSRYLDWFISTPIMLFTTALYFTWRQGKTEDIWSFVKEHWKSLAWIVALNAGMLAFGLAAEYGMISRWFGFAAGTLCLVGAFWILRSEFAAGDRFTEWMWAIMFGIWSMYGVAFMTPAVTKNVAYSILDILAKNFFGVFLVTQIVANRASERSDAGAPHTPQSHTSHPHPPQSQYD